MLRSLKVVALVALLLSAFLSCQNNSASNPNPVTPTMNPAPMGQPNAAPVSPSAEPMPMNSTSASSSHKTTTKASENGSGGDMPAYYDHQLFTINFKEEPANAEKSLLAHNKSINTIYMSDPGLPGGKMFISVLDAIQGDGFNPLWQEVQITFNAGHTPRQLFSDDEIDEAADSGEVTLTTTTEIYRCSVVGSKK